MKFRMIDGEVYAGKSYTKVVAKMAKAKLSEPDSIDTYRRATARRVADNYGVMIDATTNATFIHSLVAAKLMEEVS